MSLYSLDDTISQFFANCTVTREKCNQKAVELAGEAVKPVWLQGAFSYTVATEKLLVQFRVPESLLDTKILDLARKIHGRFVPVCLRSSVFGSLAVYVMEKVPGVTFIEAPSTSSHNSSWQEKTVSDFARFFAESWRNRLAEPYRTEHSLVDIRDKLDKLSQQLPPRFTSVISNISKELDAIFVPSYPLVLSHGDLCEMNIMVDSEAGGITGIIDWAEAKVLPFGMSLWGVLNMFGFMNCQGWHYHENSSRLESLFWEVFNRNAGEISPNEKRAIKIAERAGLVLRYGFTWDNGVRERPVTERDASFRYLDAFFSRLKS
ncbi:uncharacterized protein TRUGW13939_06061 [Talaromyces rugulosus]|uniref:Aminoglycoside phosphotransferase domain-containing protein n=1 Tax=Talaromyces rugulosus TaxID=121627 RepID=A0A7H8R258_TALRU|nr:uncharacterized protein TRUGW13939_06061 [Talaromyces rugulosus]QKX58933.1 hypothetical protein TRUGW13939_06061 [Talaromyces rugulosus]